ncbi:hypothetical protein GCM10010508_63370 [Streptomyces naganishii JCM 4654]|uniref:Uncharacterized protein n=1 Tax=Streptomyces naganishii JCM 4654 TaxID=1306179 RepID=A0A918Y9N8_9ACTN|nr:hypothetical protein GCM10010508_63370 [Streptomyces naganishii JCM 4654]
MRWALSQNITGDLSFPAERWNGPSQAMVDEARWNTARACCTTTLSSLKTACGDGRSRSHPPRRRAGRASRTRR